VRLDHLTNLYSTYISDWPPSGCGQYVIRKFKRKKKLNPKLPFEKQEEDTNKDDNKEKTITLL